MPLNLQYVPHQPYVWARVFEDDKEIGCIHNRTGNFEVLVKGGNGKWIPFDIQSSHAAAHKCSELYHAIAQDVAHDCPR